MIASEEKVSKGERRRVVLYHATLLPNCNNPAPNRNRDCDKIVHMVSVGKNHRFKEWLLEEMGRREWSQADLARSADLNRAVINKLLNGQSSPSPATLEAIARAFKVPVESVYRLAGLLPSIPEPDSFIEEALHLLGQIKNPQRQATALLLIKALVTEEEQENSKR